MQDFETPLSAAASLLSRFEYETEAEYRERVSEIVNTLDQYPSVAGLMASFNLDKCTAALILLVIVPEQYSQYQGLFLDPDTEQCLKYPCLCHILAIVYETEQEQVSYGQLLNQDHSVFKWKLLILEEVSRARLHRQIRPHKNLLDHFNTESQCTLEYDEYGCLENVVEIACPDLPAFNHAKENSVIQLYGLNEVERKFQASLFSSRCGKVLYEINSGALLGYEQNISILRELLQLIALKNGMLYWAEGLNDSDNRLQEKKLVCDWVLQGNNTVFYSSDTLAEWPLVFMSIPTYSECLYSMRVEDQEKSWREIFSYYFTDVPEIDWSQIALVTQLTCSSIHQVCMTLRAESKPTNTASILSISRQLQCGGLSQFAQYISPKWKMDDLVLSDITMQQLYDVKYQLELFIGRYQRGLVGTSDGVIQLFWGPPGTGKTMAAYALAESIGIPVFRVDIASISSKWIGETEKNLERIFTESERFPCVVFFDEADGLFSKRTSIESQQDKSSNLGVNYLLQRIESHKGILVLATNYIENLDPAFLRRVDHTLRFDMPNAKQRHRHWTHHLIKRFTAAGITLDHNVDFDYIANSYKLSATNIEKICKKILINKHRLSENIVRQSDLEKEIKNEIIHQKRGRADESFMNSWRLNRAHPCYIHS